MNYRSYKAAMQVVTLQEVLQAENLAPGTSSQNTEVITLTKAG